MLIIVAGTIGRSGLGGQAWAIMQYLLGFQHLGHEVFYLEDCGDTSYVYDWQQQEPTAGLDYPASYVHACLSPIGLADRWMYRTDTEWRGLAPSTFEQVCAKADVLIMRAVPLWTWRSAYDGPRRRVFIDVDPAFTQFALAREDAGLVEGIDRCESLFTYGQNIGTPACTVPTMGREWLKTLPPVSLPHWPVIADRSPTHFTSLVRWKGYREEIVDGITYGQRNMEFPRYLHLPRMVEQPLRMATVGADTALLEAHGWEIVNGETVSQTPSAYQKFIQASRGEFLIPKHAYVASRSGWFSDRSVCYLASGRPVVVEDTGLENVLPLGYGVLTFTDPASAANSIAAVNGDYDTHCRAARAIAEQIFASETVLPALLDVAVA